MNLKLVFIFGSVLDKEEADEGESNSKDHFISKSGEDQETLLGVEMRIKQFNCIISLIRGPRRKRKREERVKCGDGVKLYLKSGHEIRG